MKHALQITAHIEDEFLWDVLTCAAEGGIGYWANYNTRRSGTGRWVQEIRNIRDAETDEKFIRTKVDRVDVLFALRRIVRGDTNVSERFRQHVIKAVSVEDGICELDCDDCDNIVQIALLDEVVFA